MSRGRPGDRTARRRLLRSLFLALLALHGADAGLEGQASEWTARASTQLLSVRDAEDWLTLRQEVERVFSDGRRLHLGVRETRRFGAWDTSVEAGATFRPGRRLHLSLDARVTPEAEVLEDARLGVRAALPVGEFVPSVGYRLQLFPDGPVHTASPRLEWYRGPWLLSGELRVIRSAVETVNFAAIGRVTRRVSVGWRLWVGLAAGEEDFLVGRPPDRSLRTLATRSLLGGAELRLPSGWSLRLDLTGVASDPRLDRVGGSLTVARGF